MLLTTFLKSTSGIGAALLSLLLLEGVQGHAVSVYNNMTQVPTGFPPCDALIDANLSHLVHLPSSPLYSSLVKATWNAAAQQQSWCFVTPRNTAEVSQIITALRSAGDGAGDWHIAVRCGGHAGDNANVIQDGVTIDLTHMNTTTYDAASSVASVGGGSRWGDVYADLAEHGITVTGGRQGVVGVGGLLLGGGISWYSGRTGFACDGVVNYEVVLASGEIINVNATSNSDLWRALRGGGPQFGIVTRFDLETFPSKNLTIQTRTIEASHSDAVADAIYRFVNLDRSFQDNAMIAVIAHSPDSGNSVITVTQVNTDDDANSTAFDDFKDIPTLKPSEKQSVTLTEAASGTVLGNEPWNVGAGSLTIANDARVLRYGFEQHHRLVAELNATIGADAFSTIIDLQPIPAYLAEISLEKGGNMLGLKPNSRNKILFAPGVSLLTAKAQRQQQHVNQLVSTMFQRVKAFSESVGSSEEFIYMPYSKAPQNPIGSYGKANVAFIKKVANKYDPHGFFQSRVPGGFKIDRVV